MARDFMYINTHGLVGQLFTWHLTKMATVKHAQAILIIINH